MNVLKIMLGASSGDKVSTVSGYFAAVLVSYVSSLVPAITPETPFLQACGYGIAFMLAVMGRMILSK